MNTVLIWLSCWRTTLPWVADGLRSLGSSVDRKEFQNLLVEMLEENNIEFVRVEEDDYDSPFPALCGAGAGDDGRAEITVTKRLKGEV